MVELKILLLLVSAASEKVFPVAVADVDSPNLFVFKQNDYYPVASRTRSYSKEDSAFIKTEIKGLLSENIIEPSKSPWRAQLLAVRNRKNCRNSYWRDD